MRSQNIDIYCTYPGPDPHICGSGFRSHSSSPSHPGSRLSAHLLTNKPCLQVLRSQNTETQCADPGPDPLISGSGFRSYHHHHIQGPLLSTNWPSMSPGFEVPNPIHVCIQVPPPSSHPGPILSIDQPSLQILRSQPNPCLYSGPIPITSRALWVLTNQLSSFWGPKPIHVLTLTSRAQEKRSGFLPFYPGPDLEISGSGFRSHLHDIERPPWILTKPSLQLLRSQTHPCLNTKIPGSGQTAGFGPCVSSL